MNTYKIAFAALAAGLMWLAPQAKAADNKGTIGISMPTKSSLRWIADGNNMVAVPEGERLRFQPPVCR